MPKFRLSHSRIHPAAKRIAAAMAAAALIAASGCAQPPPRAQGTQPVQAAPAAAEPAREPQREKQQAAHAAPEPLLQLPQQELTETILYEFLLAEIAGQRGSVGLAAQAYADLAKRTRDPRIARRATEIAVFARMNNAAIEAAKVWHEAEPQSQRALQALASLLVNTGRLEEVLPYLRKLLLGASGEPGESFMQLNRTLGSAQDKAAALALVQRLVEDYPQVAQARYALAQAAANAEQQELALKEIRRAQQLKPDWEAPVLFEAQLLQRTSSAEALARLSRYLERNPNSREVRLSYARALVAEHRYTEARGEFQKLLANFPANTDVIYAVALLSMQLSDYGLAETNLKRLLELGYRDRASVQLYLGQIAEERKNFPEALRRYAEVSPGEQYLPAQIRYAQVLAKQGQLAEARTHLQQVRVSGNQQRVQIVLAEAQMLREASQHKEAFTLVERALEGLPDNPDLLYDYAMLAERLDRVDILESSLRKVIALRPDYAHAYNALGYTLADRNMRLREAHELVEKALKLSPEDAFIIDSMGWVHYRMGNLDEALKFLRRAFSGRADPEIAAHLGEVLWIRGERAEAERILNDAAQKHPANDTLNSTIKRLKR